MHITVQINLHIKGTVTAFFFFFLQGKNPITYIMFCLWGGKNGMLLQLSKKYKCTKRKYFIFQYKKFGPIEHIHETICVFHTPFLIPLFISSFRWKGKKKRNQHKKPMCLFAVMSTLKVKSL